MNSGWQQSLTSVSEVSISVSLTFLFRSSNPWGLSHQPRIGMIPAPYWSLKTLVSQSETDICICRAGLLQNTNTVLLVEMYLCSHGVRLLATSAVRRQVEPTYGVSFNLVAPEFFRTASVESESPLFDLVSPTEICGFPQLL